MSLKYILQWVIIISTVYVLYRKGLLSYEGLKRIFEFIKNKFNRKKINLGSDGFEDLHPFDVYTDRRPKKIPIKIPNWLVGLAPIGGKFLEPLIRKFIGTKKYSEIKGPENPLYDPFNDNQLIDSILKELDKL